MTDAVALAERVGLLEAEVTVLQREIEESRDRESRLRARLVGSRTAGGDSLNLELVRLREQVARCSAELQAIRESRGWRVVQWFRGLVGRRW